MSEPLNRIKAIKGIDNLSDNVQLNPSRGGIYVRECDNIDIDDEGMIHRRPGYTEDPIVNSTTIRSAWSDGKTGLFIDGITFKKLNMDHTATTLINGIDPTDRMAYVAANGIIYFSNKSIVGFIKDGLSYPFPDPNQRFKTRMVGGQALEFHKNRLYAANGPNLFFSDATVLTRMDTRKNAIAFAHYIPMVKAVLDGFYLGTREGVFFLKGSDPITDLVQDQVTDVGVIEGTPISVEEDDIGKGAVARTVYWVGINGAVYKGLPGGLIVQVQDGLFSMDNLDIGTAIIRDDRGFSQYVAICQLEPGVGGSSGTFRTPRISATGKD